YIGKNSTRRFEWCCCASACCVCGCLWGDFTRGCSRRFSCICRADSPSLEPKRRWGREGQPRRRTRDPHAVTNRSEKVKGTKKIGEVKWTFDNGQLTADILKRAFLPTVGCELSIVKRPFHFPRFSSQR